MQRPPRDRDAAPRQPGPRRPARRFRWIDLSIDVAIEPAIDGAAGGSHAAIAEFRSGAVVSDGEGECRER